MSDIANKICSCFKMTVDMKGLSKLEKYISDIEKENKQLKEQLQQREQVIENAIQFLDAISLDKTGKYIAIRDYEEYRILLDILNKYKKEESE